MADIGIFPTLPGLAWGVTKSPIFQTRIQRAVSGRELRALDYPFPLWQFTLTFDFLRDRPEVVQSELRTLMGFVMLCQGAFGSFLFIDPTDNQVTSQLLPSALSTAVVIGVAAGGSGYTVGDIAVLSGGIQSGGPVLVQVSSVSGTTVTQVTPVSAGGYSVVSGTANLATTGGSGTGLLLDIEWLTQVQLVRTLGAASLVGGGFVEPVTAPNNVTAVYFDGVPQQGWSVDTRTGMVYLATAFTAAQPLIRADFSYFFRCRFVSDMTEFENFMVHLWTLKKLSFISIRP